MQVTHFRHLLKAHLFGWWCGTRFRFLDVMHWLIYLIANIPVVRSHGSLLNITADISTCHAYHELSILYNTALWQCNVCLAQLTEWQGKHTRQNCQSCTKYLLGVPLLATAEWENGCVSMGTLPILKHSKRPLTSLQINNHTDCICNKFTH